MFYDPTTAPDFRPPFRPNPECHDHEGLADGWRYKKIGFFTRRVAPHRIQRFTCLHCRRSFSSQTFSTTALLLRPLKVSVARTNPSSGNRTITRMATASTRIHSTMDRMLSSRLPETACPPRGLAPRRTSLTFCACTAGG